MSVLLFNYNTSTQVRVLTGETCRKKCYSSGPSENTSGWASDFGCNVKLDTHPLL